MGLHSEWLQRERKKEIMKSVSGVLELKAHKSSLGE